MSSGWPHDIVDAIFPPSADLHPFKSIMLWGWAAASCSRSMVVAATEDLCAVEALMMVAGVLLCGCEYGCLPGWDTSR